MFMLDLLDNLPRLRLSDDQLKAFIWVMRECGTPNVPSFKALRKFQDEQSREVGIESEMHVSALGNRFFTNQPHTLLKLVCSLCLYSPSCIQTVHLKFIHPQDWANPLVRCHIHPYPDISSTLSEAWQAGKWLKEVDFHDLSPMWADWKSAPRRHYFVEELAQLCNGTYVVPLRWVTVSGVDHFEGHEVVCSPEVSVHDP